MWETYQELAEHSISIIISPKTSRKVIASKNFKKGQLQLSCVSNEVKDVPKSGTAGDPCAIITAVMDGSAEKLVVEAVKSKAVDGFSKDAAVAPFFFLRHVHAADANMAIQFKEIKLGKGTLVIPKFVNVVAIEKGDELTRASDGTTK